MSTMDVLIINPPIGLSDKPRNIPHCLAILANIIRDKLDFCPTFIDINAHRYTEKETGKDLLMNLEPHQAIGTSLAIIIPTVLVGAYTHYRLGSHFKMNVEGVLK